MRSREMTEDSDMKGVKNEFKDSCSPPSKRMRMDGQASGSQDNVSSFPELSAPTELKFKINAHEGGCNSIIFPHNSQNLISGGKDSTVKIWDASTGALTSILQGFQGSVYDLSISSDNSFLVAALTSRKLCVWDLHSGQIGRTFSGHRQKVCAVDVGKELNRYIVSGGADEVINFWDMQRDYPICSGFVPSPCNAISFTLNDTTICSGHANGKVMFSKVDRVFLKQSSKVEAHTQSVTSIWPLQNGSLVLSSGRDNWQSLIDTRTMQICRKFRTRCSRVTSNWSRVCVSSDENYAVVGSADGSVYVWSMQMGRMVNALKGHTASVLACSWSSLGRPLASADNDGNLCIWS